LPWAGLAMSEEELKLGIVRRWKKINRSFDESVVKSVKSFQTNVAAYDLWPEFLRESANCREQAFENLFLTRMVAHLPRFRRSTNNSIRVAARRAKSWVSTYRHTYRTVPPFNLKWFGKAFAEWVLMGQWLQFNCYLRSRSLIRWNTFKVPQHLYRGGWNNNYIVGIAQPFAWRLDWSLVLYVNDPPFQS
jgi:hypothetical protein